MGDEGFGLIQIFQHILGMVCINCWRPSKRQWCLMSCSFIGGRAELWAYGFVFCYLLPDGSLDVDSVENFRWAGVERC